MSLLLCYGMCSFMLWHMFFLESSPFKYVSEKKRFFLKYESRREKKMRKSSKKRIHNNIYLYLPFLSYFFAVAIVVVDAVVVVHTYTDRHASNVFILFFMLFLFYFNILLSFTEFYFKISYSFFLSFYSSSIRCYFLFSHYLSLSLTIFSFQAK